MPESCRDFTSEILTTGFTRLRQTRSGELQKRDADGFCSRCFCRKRKEVGSLIWLKSSS